MVRPSLDKLREFLKSEHVMIRDRGYSELIILDCINAYCDRQAEYRRIVKAFTNQIQNARSLKGKVHSVRFRLKEPLHVADKLARKCLDKKSPRNITTTNLFDPDLGITDFGGVRILHSRMEHWKPITRYLLNPVNMTGLSLYEKKAFVEPTEKTRAPYKVLFRKREFKYDEDKRYTSLHFIFKGSDSRNRDIFFECQVRTLFEEGWAEIDHQVNYPYKANSILRGYIDSLNTSAKAANEIASKLETLKNIPLLMEWDAELRLERSADRVLCVTPALQWVAKHLNKFVIHVKQSIGTFHYFILKDDTTALLNLQTVSARLTAENLLGYKVFLNRVPTDKSAVPVIADLLLLEDPYNPKSGKVASISVIGAPAQKRIPMDQRLDMIITEAQAVETMQRFFTQIDATP
jgi:ppGpp synthetase/RelA/SpoT-type nucleotidyltranferase